MVGLPVSSMSKDQTKFSAGQIWAYKTRPQDSGSLIRIYRTEILKYGDKKLTVHHISMIGLSLKSNSRDGEIGHLPVSPETLKKSVTKLVRTGRKFPDAKAVEGGIALWRKEQGGVFTISLAEIADILEQATHATR